MVATDFTINAAKLKQLLKMVKLSASQV
jgi:hypothetical protein